MEVINGIFHEIIVAYSFKILLKSSIMDSYWNILPKIVARSSKIIFKSSIMSPYWIQLSPKVPRPFLCQNHLKLPPMLRSPMK